MNFKKIMMIFLVVFIGLDIFLGLNYFSKQNINFNLNSPNNKPLEQLKKENIDYGDVSSKRLSGAYYSAISNSDWTPKAVPGATNKVTTVDNTKISEVTLDTPRNIRASSTSKLKQFVTDNVEHGKDYYLANDLSDKTHVVFLQQVAGKPIYSDSAKVTLHFSGNKLTGFTQTYTNDFKKLKNEQLTISSEQAVLTLYTSNVLLANSKVEFVHFGYTVLLMRKNQNLLVPVWTIGILNVDSRMSYRQVNAIDGSVMKSNTAYNADGIGG